MSSEKLFAAPVDEAVAAPAVGFLVNSLVLASPMSLINQEPHSSVPYV